MRNALACCLLGVVAFGQSATPQLGNNDAIRIHEFYRLLPQIANQAWPDLAQTPAPLLLVTQDTEFLIHYQNPPRDFQKIADDLYVRPRHFAINLLATFPAFGPPSVIVIGQAEQTDAKTSTPWLMTLMHEHFHQLQDSTPGLFDAAKNLGLAHGDETGMWMLNYPFPYDDPELVRSYQKVRDLLVTTLKSPDDKVFQSLARRYVVERKKFFGQLALDDRKYLSFQLWKEGIARYVQVRSAETAAQYPPTPEYAALPDYESFANYAANARTDTLKELQESDLAKGKRGIVYSFGACEGFLLDRLHSDWKNGYFQHLFTLDPYF